MLQKIFETYFPLCMLFALIFGIIAFILRLYVIYQQVKIIFYIHEKMYGTKLSSLDKIKILIGLK